MVDFFCRQERTFGLGNFINCTPTLRALSDYYGQPIPVLFETVGEAFRDCQFIKHIKKPKGKELFGSYDINSRMPDWEFIFKKVENELSIKLGEIPPSYVDNRPFHQSKYYYVVLRGCFSNIPHKISAKDPGNNIYIEIIRHIEQSDSIKPVFVGTHDDYLRNEFVSKIIGRRLEWNKTTLRGALALVSGSAFIIGNDTGLMHAAAALNKKAFCMWERTSFVKNQARNKIDYSMANHFINFRKWISTSQ